MHEKYGTNLLEERARMFHITSVTNNGGYFYLILTKYFNFSLIAHCVFIIYYLFHLILN
jgi:hypothetical protein